MKLAEALTERADLQRQIAQLENRLMLNAKVQEGESPAEDPAVLLAELDADLLRMQELIQRINKTNSATFDGGESLTDLLARRDCQSRKAGILRAFLDNASATTSRATRSEIRILSTVPVAEMQKQLDAQARELRQLDVRIQGLNWTTELL